MAYDPATRTMLLFGGFSDIGAGYLGDTWSWNGTTWTQLYPSTSPPAREYAPTAYDAATRTVLLFGGGGRVSGDEYAGGYGPLSDTWSWNGTTWTKLSARGNPGGSLSDSMAYDPATRTVLLYNGWCSPCPGQGQTWSWNGATWTRLSPPASPPASDGLSGSSMAYDPATATVLLWLGDQTWSWNGATWTRLSPPASPPVSVSWSMAYDPASATVLLFGGIGDGHLRTGAMVPLDYLDETWSWNGTTWTELHPRASPASRGEASMAYDPGTQAMLLVEDADEGYGQLSLTWTLRAPSPPGGHQLGRAPGRSRSRCYAERLRAAGCRAGRGRWRPPPAG